MPIYRRIDGAWVPQTVYRRINDSWVTQTGKMVVNGVWVNVSAPPAPTYAWDKYNADSEYINAVWDYAPAGETDHSEMPAAQAVVWTVATGSSFDTATGNFSVSGSAFITSNGGGYDGSGHVLYEYYINQDLEDPNIYRLATTVYSAYEVTQAYYEYSQGSTFIETVTSTDQYAYPDGGYDNDYWYANRRTV